jgi:hypothetical protein
LALTCASCALQTRGAELPELEAQAALLKVAATAPKPPPITTTISKPPTTTTTTTTGTGFLGTLATVGFTPSHGAVLYGTEPWYNPTAGANGSITIEGGASYLPAALVTAGNLQVHINGLNRGSITWSNVGARGGEIRFTGQLPAYIDPYWVQREINVQIVNPANNRVLARSTSIIYDLRREGAASPNAKPDPFVGMSAHFMPSGIGDGFTDDWTISLETPHLASLPLDGLTAFNADLEDAVRGQTVPEQPIDVCFGLDETDDAFRSLPQYAEVYAQAAAYYAVYLAYENGGEEACLSAVSAVGAAVPALGLLGALACGAALNDWCVTDIPRDSDFKICFSRLEGDPTDLSIESVSDVQLSFGTSNAGAVVNAQLVLDGVEGRVDGLLRGATLRWHDEKCDGEPAAAVSDAAFIGNKEAAAATVCPDLELSAESAVTAIDTGAAFLVSTLPVDDEQISVSQTAEPVLSFVEPDVFARSGPCEEVELWAAADALVESFQDSAERALSDTWSADSGQADALELLLERVELGLTDHDSYALEADITTLRSDGDGADLAYETLVRSTVPIVDTDDTMYYHPALDAPFSPNGMAPEDAEVDFDLAFTINTGFLNQIISTQAKTELLYVQFAPSWEELGERFGATPANTGHPADVAPPLDGKVLSHLHSAFAELGGRTVEMHIRPTLDPLAWMNPDPPLQDNADLAFGIGAMEVTFSEPERIDPATNKPVPGMTWLTARYNLRETNFDLSVEDGSDVLAIPPELSTSYLTILSTRFTSCPMVTSSSSNGCEAGLASALGALMQSLIEPRMLSMLTRIPVPNVWDAKGETPSPVELRVVRQVQMNQNITFVADIEDL